MIEISRRNSSYSDYNVKSLLDEHLCEFKEPEHFNYEKPIEYWLIVIGLTIGYGSFWRFPYLIYSCG